MNEAQTRFNKIDPNGMLQSINLRSPEVREVDRGS